MEIYMNSKQKILNFLTKTDGFNTLSVAQARARFNIHNVAARVHELREDGYPIYTNTRTRGDGSKVAVYRIGTPSRAMKRDLRNRGIKLQTV
jgi:hypothetical protein